MATNILFLVGQGQKLHNVRSNRHKRPNFYAEISLTLGMLIWSAVIKKCMLICH